MKEALQEDLGPNLKSGDITTDAIVDDDRGSAVITANQDCIVAGLPVVSAVFAAVGDGLECRPEICEGERVAAGAVITTLHGNLKAILKGERTALNFLSNISGIATLTSEYVEAVAGTGADILDTRKTTPGLRAIEKYAVTIGGGKNHRFGLFDAVLIKDNHLVNRSIKEVVERLGSGLLVEVEVETLEQLEEAIVAGADIVLLDNMSLPLVKKAVKIGKGRTILEVSGGINLGNVREMAMTGVERISIGAITQAAPAIDFSLTVI